MRTPKEAFEKMCSCHGEIWTLTETGTVRTTKDKDGNKVRDTKAVIPLEIYDLLKATCQRYAFRNWLMGGVEILVSTSVKNKLEQEHTKVQLIAEHPRAAAELESRVSDMEDIVAKVKEALVSKGGQIDDHFEDIFKGRSQDEHNVN